MIKQKTVLKFGRTKTDNNAMVLMWQMATLAGFNPLAPGAGAPSGGGGKSSTSGKDGKNERKSSTGSSSYSGGKRKDGRF